VHIIGKRDSSLVWVLILFDGNQNGNIQSELHVKRLLSQIVVATILGALTVPIGVHHCCTKRRDWFGEDLHSLMFSGFPFAVLNLKTPTDWVCDDVLGAGHMPCRCEAYATCIYHMVVSSCICIVCVGLIELRFCNHDTHAVFSVNT
jgi:hypothetical protein